MFYFLLLIIIGGIGLFIFLNYQGKQSKLANRSERTITSFFKKENEDSSSSYNAYNGSTISSSGSQNATPSQTNNSSTDTVENLKVYESEPADVIVSNQENQESINVTENDNLYQETNTKAAPSFNANNQTLTSQAPNQEIRNTASADISATNDNVRENLSSNVNTTTSFNPSSGAAAGTRDTTGAMANESTPKPELKLKPTKKRAITLEELIHGTVPKIETIKRTPKDPDAVYAPRFTQNSVGENAKAAVALNEMLNDENSKISASNAHDLFNSNNNVNSNSAVSSASGVSAQDFPVTNSFSAPVGNAQAS